MPTLRFLGTGGSVISRDRMCSGILYQDKLVDVGVGVLTNLLRSETKLDSINDLFISHVHADHVGDFTALVWAMAMEERTKPLRVISSASSANALKSILELQATPKAWVKFDIVFLRPEEVGIQCFPTLHEPENLAYRFETGTGGVVFVGDTARYEKVAGFARGCDTIIHDATFLKGQESLAALTNHSTARDAAVAAKEARATRLVLTHISPNNKNAEKRYLEEAAEHFDGQVIVARDNRTITV